MTLNAEIVDTTLTSEIIAVLLSERKGTTVKGKIYPHPRQTRCPICNQLFELIPNLGYICKTHLIKPEHFRLYFKGDDLYNDERGKPLRSFKDAQEFQSHINKQLEEGIYDRSIYVKSEKSKFYIDSICEQYLETKKSDIAPSNWSAFKHDIKLFKTFYISKDIRDIQKKKDITSYLEHLEKLYSNDKTRKNKFDAFMAFLNWCRDEEIIKHVPPKPEITYEEKEAESVDQDTRVAIFEAIPQEHKPLFACMMLQTVRPGEARALRCKDISIESKKLHIHATFSKNTYQEKRKGVGAKPYKQPIHPELYAYFAFRKATGADEDYIYLNPYTGRPYMQEAYLKVWRVVREALSLPESLRFYEVGKHSSITLLKQQGASDKTLMDLFGLSNVSTLRKYDHYHEDYTDTISALTLKKEMEG